MQINSTYRPQMHIVKISHLWNVKNLTTNELYEIEVDSQAKANTWIKLNGEPHHDYSIIKAYTV